MSATESKSIDYERAREFLRRNYWSFPECTFSGDRNQHQSEVDLWLGRSAVRAFIRQICEELNIDGVTGEPDPVVQSARRW